MSNNIGGIFFKQGFTGEQRKYLFYLICIFFRMFLAGVVYNFSNKKMVQYAVLFAGLVAVYFNFIKMCDNVWW